MNNITIGIPRGLLYEKYKILWLAFFKELNIDTIISPQCEEKMDNVNNEFKNDLCLPFKLYLKSINYLLDKVDYILIERDQSERKCYYYSSAYDVVNNIFDANFLCFDIKNNEETSFLKIGKKLGFSDRIIQNAYNVAKKEEYKQNKIKYLLQEKKLKRNNKKILLISDCLISNEIDNILKHRNIEVIYSNITNPDNNINNIQRIINKVDGILYITTKTCIPENIKKYNYFKSIRYNKSLIIDVCNRDYKSIFNSFLDKVISHE